MNYSYIDTQGKKWDVYQYWHKGKFYHLEVIVFKQ